MKKFSVLLACLMFVLAAVPAWAVPAFNEAFKKAYVKEGMPLEAKVAEVKCNVCHMGKEKKMKNEFGNAVGKYLKKADFTGEEKKYEPKSPEADKALADGLEKAAAEKSSNGKTFGELLKSGELPAKEE